jgi:hypothetical protein
MSKKLGLFRKPIPPIILWDELLIRKHSKKIHPLKAASWRKLRLRQRMKPRLIS